MDVQKNLHNLPLETTSDQEIAANLRRIEKRDWWIWANSIFVMLLLTGALISFTLPSLSPGATPLFRIKVTEAIFGLVALVVLFNVYTIYQQVLIKRLRRQLAEKQHHSMILRDLAMIDALTGLYNRRFAEQRLVAEVARSARKGHPLTVVLLDLDEFKLINDTYGHPAGDLVLQEFAAALNRAIREWGSRRALGRRRIFADSSRMQSRAIAACSGPARASRTGLGRAEISHQVFGWLERICVRRSAGKHAGGCRSSALREQARREKCAVPAVVPA